MTKRSVLVSLIVALGVMAMLAPASVADDTAAVITDDSNDGVQAAASEAVAASGDKVVVYYLHGTRRCATCLKLEAYSEEAVTGAFARQLESGELEWKTVDYDEEENKHFVEDYGLFTKSVILSRVVDGKESEWKNLDQIWQLVGDKDDFISYVQLEVANFMVPDDATDEK